MKILAVFLNENKRLWREKGLILILLLMPLAFIAPIGMSYTSGTAGSSDNDRPLLVIDYDGGKQAQDLIETLDENFRVERNLPLEDAQKYQLEGDPACASPGPACDEKIARAQLKKSDRALALLIPAGLSDAYAQSKQTIVTLLYDPTGDVNVRDQVLGVIKGATISISLEKQIMQGQQDMEDLTSIAPETVKNAVANAAEKTSTKDLKSAIAFTQIAPTNYLERKPPNALQQAIPGFTVMFAFLVAGFMAGWSVEEKQNGILRRLRSSPVRTSHLLGGKLFYGLVICLVQVLVLFLVSSTLFKLDLGGDPLAFVLVCGASSLNNAPYTVCRRGLPMPAVCKNGHIMQRVEITVKKRIDFNWSEWFEGMTIQHTDQDETILTGTVVDQAALYGLLTKLRNLGLSLVSVNSEEVESTSPDAALP